MGRSVNDPHYFTIEFRIMTIVPGAHGPLISFENKTYHPCNDSDSQNPVEMLLLTDSYCLDNNTILLQGDFGDPFTSLLQINIYQCQNSTENNNSCKTPQEIQDYFNMKNLNLKYRNTILQLKNYDVPSVETLSSVTYKCEVKLNRLVTINLQKAVIITEEGGILGNSITTQERFLFEKEKIEMGFPMAAFQPIFTTMFFSSNNVLNAGRTYQTLIQAFAMLGGLFSILVILGSIISKVDNAVYLTTLLLNFLYTFHQEDSDHSQKEDKESHNFTFKSTKTIQKKYFIDPMDEETHVVALEKPLAKLHEPLTNNVPKTPNLKCTNNAFKLEKKVLKEESVMFSSGKMEKSELRLTTDKSPKFPILKVNNDSFLSPVKKESESLSQSPNINKPFNRLSSQIKRNKNKKISLQQFFKIIDKSQEISFNIFEFLKLLGKKLIHHGLTFKERLYTRAQEGLKTKSIL